MSFVFHVVVLSLMAIPIYRAANPGSVISTTVTEADPEPNLISTNIDVDTLLAPPDISGGGSDNMDQLLTAIGEIPQDAFNSMVLDNKNATKGDSTEPGQDGGLTGIRIKEPKNAVKAGSFTVFTLPIAQAFREKVEPGQAPRPGQDYFIVVQLAMPRNRSIYPLRDLTGVIVGTDGYRQKVPEGAFIMGEKQQFLPAPVTQAIPVVDGVVQVFIRVPGADRLVQDKIHVSSRLLREKQDLEIIFK